MMSSLLPSSLVSLDASDVLRGADIGQLSRQYREDGYVTFDGQYGPADTLPSSFLEGVAGIPLQEARDHLDACVLYGTFDMQGRWGYAPTKVPPANYVAELRPLVEEQKRLQREQLEAAQRAAEDAKALAAAPSEPDASGDVGVKPPGFVKKPKAPKPPPKYNGKARRTVHAIDVHVCDSTFYKLATNPAIGQLVSELTGWGEQGVGVRLLETQVWMKPPRCTVPLAFHRDTPYFGFLSPLDICTVWFTFDDVSTLERAQHLGGLEYAKGSHLWSQEGGIEGVFFDKDYKAPMKKASLEHVRIQAKEAGDGQSSPEAKKLRPEVPQAGSSSAGAVPSYEIHYVVVPAGGVSFHNGMLWHGSGSNLSETDWRRGIGIHYIRADAQFKPEYAAYDEEPPAKATPAVGETDAKEDGPAPPKRPYLSNMWAPHKQKGSLLLDDTRFPIIWNSSKEAQ